MDDDTYYTIQIKGTAYRFQPVPEDTVATLMVVLNMGASVDKSVKALMRALGRSAGPEQWDEITDRLIEGELTVNDVSITLFKELVKRQSKSSGQEPKARRPRKARGPVAVSADGE
jgi:hypothetical protein